MTLFKLIREYIAAIRAQTAATIEATAAANRAISDAAWTRYMEQRGAVHAHGHGHYHGHHPGGNASIQGGCE